MDAPENKNAASPPKNKRSFARLIGMGLLVIGMGLLGVLAIGVIAGVAIWAKNQGEKRRNLEDTILQELKQPQRIALDAVAADSGAKEALGDEIKDVGGLGRDDSGELDRTSTVLHFDVAGSKGKGRVTAPAAQQQGAWQITGDIEIKLTDGKTVKVPKPGDKPPEIEL